MAKLPKLDGLDPLTQARLSNNALTDRQNRHLTLLHVMRFGLNPYLFHPSFLLARQFDHYARLCKQHVLSMENKWCYFVDKVKCKLHSPYNL